MKLSTCFLVLSFSLLALPLYGQTTKSDSQQLLHKLARQATPPVGDLQNTSESASAKMEREVRESKWKPAIRFNVADPGEQESVKFAFEDSVRVLGPGEKPDPGGLPVSCTAIVLGTVTSATSFARGDRTSVYSDYDIKVSSVLKQDSKNPVFPNQQIVVYRTGGSIRFASGHIAHYVIVGKGFPAVAGQYILFLRRSDPEIRDYELETGYQIVNGLIDPLDGTDASPGWFKAMPVSNFLSKLQQAIAGAR